MISTIRKVVRVYVKNHSDDIITQSAVAKKSLVSGATTLQRSEDYDYKNNYLRFVFHRHIFEEDSL